MVYEIGTDIKSDWTFNENGDLTLIQDNDNLKQAVYNRITCYAGSFKHFYNEYGSVLSNYFGFRKDNTTLEFMRIELERVLLQDPRIQKFDLNLEYVTEGIRVELTIHTQETDTELNFITDGTQIINEDEVQ